jgi:hypothetical protein
VRCLGFLVLAALSGCQYAIPAARGEAPERRPDGGAPADAAPAARGGERPSSADSLIGLTRKQLLARRGAPSKKSGAQWIYTPEQPGCRDIIVSEIVTFEGDRVTRVSLQRRHTGRHCGVMPGVR